MFFHSDIILHFGQMKVLDMLNQERAAAERKNIIYKIEQRAVQGKEEALMTQVPVTATDTGFHYTQGTHG